MNQEVTSHTKTPAAEKNYLLDPAPMHFSPKQEGGGNGSNSDDEKFNFVEIDTIQNDTKNEIIIYAKILINTEDVEFNQNHWKVSKPCKHKLNQGQKFIKSLNEDQREALYYKCFQTSNHYHSITQLTLVRQQPPNKPLPEV
jgi:hypothetical protein